MVSDINQIWRLQPYRPDGQAEQTDTREEIRRHNRDEQQKKQDRDSEKRDGEIFGEDKTEVSVESLKSFLQMLLSNYSKDETGREEEIPHAPLSKADSAPAKAASAYARTAQYTPGDKTETEEISQALDRDEPDNSILSSFEIREIHKLQRKIPHLAARGIYSIHIGKGGTFLESIDEAIERALKGS